MKKLKIEDPKSHKLNVICVKSTLDKSVVSNERHHSHSGVYEGERKAGKMHGFGTYTYTNGTKYVGCWKENMMHGEGVLLWASGEKYTGSWQNDENMDMAYILGPMAKVMLDIGNMI
ncbi:hypothetical protein JTS98_06625 [Clostridium botulinum]|nr:hypothetical protein [Clostridium botulinum]